MNKDKEFVPYEPSLALKEIGFNEPWFGFFLSNERNKHTPTLNLRIRKLNQDVVRDECCSAPTFSQAFRWFREKYTLYSIISTIMHTYPNLEFYFKIQGLNDGTMIDKFNTYEEAEFACLIKLIEIVKNK